MKEGVFFLPATSGIINNCKNMENSRKFIDWKAGYIPKNPPPAGELRGNKGSAIDMMFIKANWVWTRPA
jgi:hypothetical protein